MPTNKFQIWQVLWWTVLLRAVYGEPLPLPIRPGTYPDKVSGTPLPGDQPSGNEPSGNEPPANKPATIPPLSYQPIDSQLSPTDVKENLRMDEAKDISLSDNEYSVEPSSSSSERHLHTESHSPSSYHALGEEESTADEKKNTDITTHKNGSIKSENEVSEAVSEEANEQLSNHNIEKTKLVPKNTHNKLTSKLQDIQKNLHMKTPSDTSSESCIKGLSDANSHKLKELLYDKNSHDIQSKHYSASTHAKPKFKKHKSLGKASFTKLSKYDLRKPTSEKLHSKNEKKKISELDKEFKSSNKNELNTLTYVQYRRSDKLKRYTNPFGAVVNIQENVV